MVKKQFKYVRYYVLILTAFLTLRVMAQMPVRRTAAPAAEIKKAYTVVVANQDSFKAHRNYIYAMGIDNRQLAVQYKAWMEKYPNNANIPLAVGTVYYNAEMPQAKDYLLRAAELQPQNAKIWFMLSGDAIMRGQDSLSATYIQKAAIAEPSNPGYVFAYISTFKNNSSKVYEQKVIEFLNRFPNSEQAAAALYWLAEESTNQNDKINYFEQLRALFPPKKFRWSASGMIGLADIYLQTNPNKALSLINEMDDSKDWQTRKKVAETMTRIDQLSQQQQYKTALDKLDSIKLPQFNYLADFMITKKAALLNDAGNADAAYSSLAKQFAKLPTSQLENKLLLYGKQNGKNQQQVIKDIETIRDSTATEAYPFELGRYTTSSKLSLADLKGKVVLLTFWFPGCSPCKAEFPHFQAVIDKFKNKDVVYLGINVFPEQDDYVMPFLRNSKFSFIPLRGDKEFAKKYYNVDGEPENFLIDKEGRIVFKDFTINSANQHTLELMISSLL